VHVPFFDAPATGDQFHDAADVAANVADIRNRKTVFDVSANVLFRA
jgi:hypothetical protein